ncbi:beta-taxilin-like, partial [Poecilia latipinna]
EETLQRCREDDLKRKEITTHFQGTLSDIQAQIEEHSSRNTKLCQENGALAEKLKALIAQYDQREANLEKVFKHRDLKEKLLETKLEQANLILKEAEGKHKLEKELLLKQVAEYKLQLSGLKEQETDMRSQLDMYSKKFDEFQGTVSKSNSVYSGFKQDMDKMAKKMKKLEKECHSWKTRFDSCNKNLIDMVADRTIKEKEFELLTIKNQKLESLCRALQEQRKNLSKQVQGAQPDKHTDEQAQKEGGDVPEAATDQKEDHPAQDTGNPASAESPVQTTPLTEALAKLKAEQALLKEIAGSFTISHTTPTESADSQSHGLSEGIEGPEEKQGEESKHQDVHEDQNQEQRDREMESVD